jgi:hypothetical protein
MTMDIHLADVVIHIDEGLSAARREEVEASLREIEGVVSVHNRDDRPHLTIVQYRPDLTNAQALLACVQAGEVHAKLVGL